MALFFRRFTVPVVFVAVLCAVSLVYTYALRPAGQRSLVAAAATNLANLRSDPLGVLLASAFVSESGPWVWPLFAVVGLFPLVHRFGNLRVLLLIGAAHVIGTLVSEGLLAWRISTGAEPASLRFLDDVGPSYVITSALLGTLLYGSASAVGAWRVFAASGWWRLAAAAALGVLAPYIFAGLGRLDVAAVGHVVAMVTGAAVGFLLPRPVAPAGGAIATERGARRRWRPGAR
ncbi:rhomboid-like protein [Actinoallomurus iriomotensis]|uniref:Uncharacterized protein n=1 Tax=Actinoallomurus iriomotensis TaxID=478107 RepID=A0A9W6RZM6_9ACTN|nr:rhomboid-like protein [Actinoallomurus iriomotensis]GLY84493.1 hypothetical protein Airi02_024220 [Actinoallomurus iriomotensis]